MKKYLKIIIPVICLLLCIALTVTLLSTCNGNKGDKKTGGKGENAGQSISENSSDGSTADFEEDNADSFDQDDLQDDNPEETDPEDEDIWVETMNVYNSKTPIMTNYRGMSANVWHAFGFMKNDRTGRVYSDEMMDLELTRQYDAGIRYCRTRYDSRWMWNEATGWNWNSERMNYFYDYCRALQKRDTSVLLNLGWHFFELTGQNASIGEVNYLSGVRSSSNPDPSWTGRYDTVPDRYGECFGYDLSKYDNYYKNLAIGALRYAEWGAQTILELKKRGINNVTHYLYFTESNYTTDRNVIPVKEYYFVCDLIKQKYVERGVDKMIKHVGPNQGSTEHRTEQLNYILKEKGRTDLFDVYTDHTYIRADDITRDVYGDLAYEWFSAFVQPLKDVGIFNNQAGKEFWVDEFNCGLSGVVMGDDSPWSGVQNVVGALMAQKVGIQNIVFWQLYDQLWTDQTNTSAEFENGIQITGCAPSLFVSSIPHSQYYLTSLFSRYNGYKNGTVYATNSGESYNGIYIGCVKLEDGNYTVTVVNTNFEPVKVIVEFDKALNKTLYRHQETIAVEPETQAHLASADKTYVSVQDKFCDTLPAGCVAVYTSIKG